MAEFTLEVITPQGCLLKEQVEEATIVTQVGEIGVLPGHCEYMALLGDGMLVYVKNSQRKSLKVSRGTVQVNADSAVILSEHAEIPEAVTLQ